MDLTKQNDRAAEFTRGFCWPAPATCIDCHKGIAHELPDMTGVEPGWSAPPDLQGQPEPQASLRSYDQLVAYARTF